MEIPVADLIALIAVLSGLTVAYGKAFATYQVHLSQWVIDAARIPGRYRGLVNLAVGVLIATAFTIIGAVALGQPMLISVGVLAGVFASVEAARLHDSADALPGGMG